MKGVDPKEPAGNRLADDRPLRRRNGGANISLVAALGAGGGPTRDPAACRDCERGPCAASRPRPRSIWPRCADQWETAVQRLNIVVPFRAREAHLKMFVPAVRAYFARDKIDREIPYRVLIVEQESGLPFNCGALRNIGFALGRDESDYTCFHDVDYLPVWADYSWSGTPTGIVWHGAETRPISLDRREARTVHQPGKFFGGVVLTPNALFEKVDGYANTYWGWGYEDTDLRKRFESVGIAVGLRKGTFQPLDHNNAGCRLDGSLTPAAEANERRFSSRWSGAARGPDGLSTLDFEIVSRRAVPEGTIVERAARWEIVTVRLRGPVPSQGGTGSAQSAP